MKTDRREFLKTGLAAGTLLTGAGALFASCSAVTRADLPVAPASDPAIAGLDRRRLSILHHASLAPSGHNSQPWRVTIENADRWIIGADPARRLPAVDPANREVMLSLGAFAENLSLAAGTFGLTADLQVVAGSGFDPAIIEVTLKEVRPVDYPLARITTRRTVKHGHLPGEIRKQDVAALSCHMKGRLFYFPRGTAHARCIEEGTIENFRIQSKRDRAQQELVKWVRLRNADARRHRDGLTPAAMEIDGVAGWFVRNFSRPADFLKDSFRRQGVQLTEKLAREGGGWFVITSKGNTVADLIDTGRKFERLALLARERGIAIHPMTQYLEEQHGRQEIADSHAAGVIPQFVLRVGYLSRYPEPVSLRRPVSWFVQSA